MKVFMCKRSGNYSGGLAIVAANSKEEAFRVLHEDPDYEYCVDNTDKDGYYTEDLDKCDSNTYPRANWFECSLLTANVDKPQVIGEDGYTE
jgi:hypothetical protein